MFGNEPLHQPQHLFGKLLGPVADQRDELTAHNHKIPGLKALSTLLLPSGDLLTATAAGDAVKVSRGSEGLANLAIPGDFSVRSVQLFTLPRFKRTEMWMGVVCRDQAGKSYDSYHRLGNDGALVKQTLDAYFNSPGSSGVYGVFTDQHSRIKGYDKAPPPSSAARNFFYIGDSMGGQRRAALWRSREGSDNWMEVKEWRQQLSTCALTSNPRRIAIGLHNGDVAVRKLKGPGDLESEGGSQFNLHRVGFKQGSRATAMEFVALDPSRPNKRDAIVIGTNLSEVGCIDLRVSALLSIDEGVTRAGERIQRVRVDSESRVHAFYGDR